MPDASQTLQEPLADARRLLQDAAVHLARAGTSLGTARPDYPTAAAEIRLCAEVALATYTTWQALAVPDRTDVAAVAGRVARMDGVLRMHAERTAALLPALAAAERGDPLGANAREALEAGWYTVRNLIVGIDGTLPARARLLAFDPGQTLRSPVECAERDRVHVASLESFPASDAPGW